MTMTPTVVLVMYLFFLHSCDIFTLGSLHSLSAQAFSSCASMVSSSRTTPIGRHFSTIGRRNSSSSSSSPSAGNECTPSGADKSRAPSPSPSDREYARGRMLPSSAVVSHHAAIKTRDIENAIDFYSLLGFRAETRFVAGPARAAWLKHDGRPGAHSSSDGSRFRIELLEVPSYMLEEPEGMKKRAIDLTKRVELLGLNHLALDVTSCIPRSKGEDAAESSDGNTCQLYQLQEWMEDLNALSIDKFGKSLRVAMAPSKRIIGREVYEMAFIFDADGTLVELLNHSGRLQQDVADGWVPWDGRGFIQ
jgi:catechol 2,3-dioxygenase-like lactoylglutathione lyase family enzyme